MSFIFYTASGKQINKNEISFTANQINIFKCMYEILE